MNKLVVGLGRIKKGKNGNILKIKNKMKKIDELSKIANKYASDKGTIAPSTGHHGPRLHFTTKYSEYMEEIKNKKLTILEIGVGSGPSLKMWYDYFPNSTIHAIDVDNHSNKNNDRVITHICDQSNRDNLKILMEQIGKVDIIIDDGSHVVEHQQISLGFLFQYVKDGGQYWIEDLHTSDREVWQGKSLYGYDMSIEDGQSTVEVLENYINTRRFKSPFMNKEEIDSLNEGITDIKMFELPKTYWGINKLCYIKK